MQAIAPIEDLRAAQESFGVKGLVAYPYDLRLLVRHALWSMRFVVQRGMSKNKT
jgi:hypothetical protein